MLNSENVRYIKLGQGNRGANYCFHNGMITLGFWSYEK
jgi:hypothetical protein